MDGKRVFQDRTNILYWADSVRDSKDSSFALVSKSRSKGALNRISNPSRRSHSISLPLARMDTVVKSPPTQPFRPAMQVVEEEPSKKNALFNSFGAPAEGIRSTEIGQPYPPTSLPRPLEHPHLLVDKERQGLSANYTQETSIQELQIRALKRAMSVLNTHITDSKDRVEELRILLAERDIEPNLLKSIQRQRWMEEKRQIAVDHLSKIVKQHIVSPPAISNAEGQWGALDSASRSSRNLVMFFESPRQRIPTRRCRIRRRVHVAPKPCQEDPSDAPSVHYHKGVIPLKLKPSPAIPAFLEDKLQAKKPDNATVESAPTSQGLLIKPKPSVNAFAQLAPIPEIPERNSSLVSPSPGPSTDRNGSAIIWRESPRSKEEILAELVVNMPDYVDDLLAGFDTHSFTAVPLDAPQETKSPQSTISKATFVPETPRPQRTLAVPLHVHKSPSRKRISALFSLPDALSSRRAVSADVERPNHLRTPPTSTIAEESATPFAVSFLALPSSDSGGSHEQEAEYKRTSRLGHRLSFFKRH